MRTGDEEEDRRARLFDSDQLADGDPVAVMLPTERRWVQGVVRRSREGWALVVFPLRDSLDFDLAVGFGVKRVLH